MKTLLFLLILTASQAAYGQKYNYRKAVAPASFALVSGAAYGFHETSVHHPDRYPAGWNANFWDNRISWRNKYYQNDPANGAKYLGSTTFLAWTTDSKHLFGTVHRVTLFGAGVSAGIVYNRGERRKWWHYAVDAAITYAAFTVGFHSIYSLAF